jgi:hypothetical protein
LHSCIWELFFAWILIVLFCWWCRALLPHLEESAILEHFISVVSSRCPCLRGPRFFLTQMIISWLLFGFWSIAWVFLSFLFFFSFLWIGYLCVLSMHSPRGDWGPEHPRTGGWLLLDVMSDWQHCCGLICIGTGEEWARKVYALRGLRGVERQVGLTRGTWWPEGSSAGRMVARKARRSRQSEPVQGSGSQPESACGVCDGSPENHRVT